MSEKKRRKRRGEAERDDESFSPSPLSARRSGRVSESERRPETFVVVGAGRLGTTLARALIAQGYEAKAFVARTLSHARRAARIAGGDALALSASQLERIPPVDLLILATPDDHLAETAARLAHAFSQTRRDEKDAREESDDARERSRKGKRALSKRTNETGGVRGVALHTSGALGSEILAPLRERGYAVGSLHPLVSVSDAASDAKTFRGAFFSVEGERRALLFARKIARELGGRSFTIEGDKKPLYHAAAVMTSGHAVALFSAAMGLLARCGLSEDDARLALLPLLRSTLENLSHRKPSRALTGTFARADAKTVRKHLAALKREADLDSLEIYAMLGRRSLRLAKEGRAADARALEEIAKALANAKAGS